MVSASIAREAYNRIQTLCWKYIHAKKLNMLVQRLRVLPRMIYTTLWDIKGQENRMYIADKLRAIMRLSSGLTLRLVLLTSILAIDTYSIISYGEVENCLEKKWVPIVGTALPRTKRPMR